MLKKSYLVIGSIIFCLLFSSKVKAYTSGYSTVTGTDLDNNSYMVRGMTYYQMYPENYGEAGEDNYSAVWNVTENYQITLLQPNRYYTGVLRFRVQISSTSSDLQRLQPVLLNNQVADGLRVYIQGETDGFYQVDVVFDNYYCENESLGLPTILNTFTYPFNSEIGLTSYAQSFTLTLSIQLSSFRSQATPFQNGLAGMITSSIDNSTALSVIAGWLYDIKIQDYSYYNQLVTQLTSLNQAQNTTNTNLITLLERLGELREYIANRPTINVDIKKNRIKLTNGQYQFLNDNGQRGVLIPKSMLIKYVYINGFVTNNGNIFYFEDDPTTTSGAYVTPTRVIKLNAGEQYYPIDFQYNENYVYFNLGAAGYGDSIFKAYIGEGYEYQAILYYINMLEEMNAEQSSEAAEQESAYAERDNQSQQLLNGMGSVQMPSISAGDLDILSQVDTTQKINFFGLIGLITHTEIVTKIMLIIVIGAIVGWVLYGKK